jgi:hypothetical protein
VQPLLEAYISGQARLAAVIDGASLVCLEAGQDKTTSRSRFEFEYLFADVGDLRVEHCNDWSEVSEKLQRAVHQDDALALFLILLDRDAFHEARQDAIPLVDEALADREVRSFLCRRLSAARLPSSADIAGSIAMARSAGAVALMDLLRAVDNLQGAIEDVCSAWEVLPDELFGMDPIFETTG